MRGYTHSYARFWLDYLGNEIFINGNNFFKENSSELKKYFSVHSLKTRLNVGESLIDEEERKEVITISVPDMEKRFGYRVCAIQAKEKRWNPKQRSILILQKIVGGKTSDLSILSLQHRGAKIEWDRYNERFRAIGQDFGTIQGQYGEGNITPWVYYGKTKAKKKIEKFDSDEFTEILIDRWMGKRRDIKNYINIPELPIMITEDGGLLCLPYEKDFVPKIIMVGKSGKGKSWCLNSILGRAFYIFQDRVGLLNDSLDQFHNLMLPMEVTASKTILGRIGNEPRHLPCINLYMSCPNLDMRYTDENISYRLVLPLQDFLYRWDYYAQGIKKFDIGSPQKYINREVVSLLETCTNAAEVRDKLFARFSQLQGLKEGEELKDNKKDMIMKWYAAIETLFREQCTSNLFKHEEKTAPYWHLKRNDGYEFTGHPFIVSYEAGIVPVVNNTLAKSRLISKKQLADLIKSIVDYQNARGDYKKRVWIGIDELKDLLKSKGDDVYQQLDYLFSQGRFPLVGFIGNIQEYSKMSDSMKNNTTHLIVFKISGKEVSMIAKDYQLDAKRLDEMTRSMKEHQCIFTTERQMVLYEKGGTRKVFHGEEMWRGKILPPITHHQAPSDNLRNMEEENAEEDIPMVL